MDVDNLQSLSDDEVVQQLKVFNTQNAYKVEFAPIIGEENKRKIVDALVERIIRDGLSVEVYTCCMETLRILCREKASMDSLYRPEMIARIISLLNRDVADNATNESIKLLVNTIISSSESRKIMLDNQIFDVVRKTLLNEKVSIQARGFCCRLLLHLTAPSDDESLKYSQNFEHQESLTVVLRSAIEALDQEHGKFTCNESFKILYHVTRLLSKEFEKEVDTPKTEATTQVATTNGTKVETETTKEDVSTTTTTITNTNSETTTNTNPETTTTNPETTTANPETTTTNPEKVSNTDEVVISYENETPHQKRIREYFDELLPLMLKVLLDERSTIQIQLSCLTIITNIPPHTPNSKIVSEEQTFPVLEVMFKLLDTETLPSNSDSQVPFLGVLHFILKSFPNTRQFFYQKIFPESECGDNVEQNFTEEENNKGMGSSIQLPIGSLRQRLTENMTSLNYNLKYYTAQVIFLICEENVDEFVRLVGVGRAAGLLAEKGLLQTQTGN